MVLKCKKGFKKVGTSCVTNKSFKKFGKFADEVQILRFALIGAISSIGGWAMFRGLIGILKLEGLNDWILLVAGIIVLIATYKFGWKKVVN